MTELAKTFEPGPIEARWYAHWEGQGLFRPERPDAEPLTIVMPPPNVTGSLHIGHALDNTLQDILTRHARMQGKDALWVVGTDHAGIATQMVVERNLEQPGRQAHRLSAARTSSSMVWEWKAQSGRRRSPASCAASALSCDWANERFTMDEGFSAAVIKVFVELYKRGLAYRDKRLVNWDPKFQTAISDLEVETREVQGQFWHLKYPLADGSGRDLTSRRRGPRRCSPTWRSRCIPTTSATSASIGKQVKHADHRPADPDHRRRACRSGARHRARSRSRRATTSTISRSASAPASSPPTCSTCSMAQARVVQTADGLIPDELLGLDRFEARKRVVELLEAEGALEKVEDRVIADALRRPLGRGDRAVADRPMVCRRQAARRAGDRARRARARSRSCPKTWAKTWFNWLENIQPWCVSRQLWWGHRIPAWYDDDGNVFVAESEDEARARGRRASRCAATRTCSTPGSRSALWPFATLGWPEQTEDLKRHYPNDVLISGFDILFFWDARMAMQGIEFMGEVPWKHALPPRPGPRRARAEDVQVEGQYGRSARPDRQIWRRRAALHAGGDGKPGPRHQAR